MTGTARRTSDADHPGTLERVVIVGAGHGGVAAASMLRQFGFAGEITLIGDEAGEPYHRPPLSKGLLGRDAHQLLQERGFYIAQSIGLKLSTIVTRVDPARKVVQLGDGQAVAYDVLILATGARARKSGLPGENSTNVHFFRTASHARALAEGLGDGSRLVVIGGGWIGLEVAASARSGGAVVTVLEANPRVLARVAGPELSSFVEAAHRSRGIDIITGAVVDGIEVEGDQACGVRLTGGTILSADLVLIAIGAVPNDSLARAAGLACDKGITVDGRARTSDASIYAVGDATERPVAGRDVVLRFESIPSAVEQAHQAAAAITERDIPESDVPWFWSDQFDLKIQLAGLATPSSNEIVRRFDRPDKLVIFHLEEGRVVAVDAVNAAAEFMVVKRMIRENLTVDPIRAADPAISIDSISAGFTPRGETWASYDIAHQVVESSRSCVTGLPRATLVGRSGATNVVDVPVGQSLMSAAVRHNVPGVIGECGGVCSCGTCHIWVDRVWNDRLEDMQYEEDDLIEFIDERQPTSRLSCQLIMTDELDGIVVYVVAKDSE